MAKDGECSSTRPAIREEAYADLEDTRRPPYFGEREPSVHIVPADERIQLQPTPHTNGNGNLAAVQFGFERGIQAARELGWQEPRKRRRRGRGDPVSTVARALWPHSDGIPPDTVGTRDAVRLVIDECKKRGVKHGHEDSVKRAIGRR